MNKERIKGLTSGVAAGILASAMFGGAISAEAATTCDTNLLPKEIPASANEQTLTDVSREWIEGDITFTGHPEKPDNDPNTSMVVIAELPVPSNLKIVAPWGGTRWIEPACATNAQWSERVGEKERIKLLSHPETQPAETWLINRP